jgi:serine/threonine-protein kinase RsbW
MILRMTLSLPSDASYVPIVRALSATLMGQLGVVGEDVDDTSLVIGEICGNVVRHAHTNPRTRYVVEIDYHAEHVLVTVIDGGQGFDRGAVPPPDPDRAGGWGLWLVENVADAVEFRPAAEGGTAVCARLGVHYRGAAEQERARRMDAGADAGVMVHASLPAGVGASTRSE